MGHWGIASSRFEGRGSRLPTRARCMVRCRDDEQPTPFIWAFGIHIGQLFMHLIQELCVCALSATRFSSHVLTAGCSPSRKKAEGGHGEGHDGRRALAGNGGV